MDFSCLAGGHDPDRVYSTATDVVTDKSTFSWYALTNVARNYCTVGSTTRFRAWSRHNLEGEEGSDGQRPAIDRENGR